MTAPKPIMLPAMFDTPNGLAALLRHHGFTVTFAPRQYPDLAEFERAVAEHEVRQLADEIGYTVVVLDGGVIELAPVDGAPGPRAGQRVETYEQLDALPFLSVVREIFRPSPGSGLDYGGLYERRSSGWESLAGAYCDPTLAGEPKLPCRVLWVP